MATVIPDARAYLERLVGQTIPTITGYPNTILAVRGDDVFVRTKDTKNPEMGEKVSIESVQVAINTLYANGRIGINTTEATHRSAFIGAVLSTLPGAVGLGDRHALNSLLETTRRPHCRSSRPDGPTPGKSSRPRSGSSRRSFLSPGGWCRARRPRRCC
jgi:hypothetical protein